MAIQLPAISKNVVTEFVRENPVITAGALAVTTGASALGVAGIVSAVKKRKASTRKGRSRDRRFISKQKHEQAYIRRKRRKGKKITRKRYKTKTSKKRGGKKVYYARKTGQPYVLLKSGKAKFIKGKRRKK